MRSSRSRPAARLTRRACSGQVEGYHIQQVEAKIAELQSLRSTLLHLVEHCHGDDRPDCPILDDLVEGPQGAGTPRSGIVCASPPPSSEDQT